MISPVWVLPSLSEATLSLYAHFLLNVAFKKANAVGFAALRVVWR